MNTTSSGDSVSRVAQSSPMYLDLAVYEPDPGSVTGAVAAETLWPLG